MISGDIRDWQISASSTTPTDWDNGCHERYARLYYGKARSWCAKYKAPSEWLQIDLGVAAKVSLFTMMYTMIYYINRYKIGFRFARVNVEDLFTFATVAILFMWSWIHSAWSESIGATIYCFCVYVKILYRSCQ